MVSPGYESPTHLTPILSRLAQFESRPFKFVGHAPPRHAKTESALHFIVWALLRNPKLHIIYVTYSDELAKEKSYIARGIAQRSGLALGKRQRLSAWTTAQGGMARFVSKGGTVTGRGGDIILLDDPVKNRAEAESKLQRQRLHDFFESDLWTRRQKNASVVVFMTRWHPDDLSGRLIKGGWDYVKLPAINEDGAALWPSWKNLEALNLERKDAGEYTWASLYQGDPRPRGGALFKEPAWYDPRWLAQAQLGAGRRWATGIDLAYTEKAHADWSVGVEGVSIGDTLYITNVVRHQLEAPKMKAVFTEMKRKRKQASWAWYASGTEAGAASFFNAFPDPLGIAVLPAKGDKFMRAQGAAAAWNAGKVQLPEEVIDPETGKVLARQPPWVDKFLSEVAGFTGVSDDHDDQVDALVACHDLLFTSGAARTLALAQK